MTRLEAFAASLTREMLEAANPTPVYGVDGNVSSLVADLAGPRDVAERRIRDFVDKLAADCGDMNVRDELLGVLDAPTATETEGARPHVDPPSPGSPVAFSCKVPQAAGSVQIVSDGKTVRCYVDGVERPDLLIMGYVAP